MTIPIQPGPFSFLAGLGQALGSFGEARTAEEHYQNLLALQRQQASQQNLALLQRIVNPEAFAQGGSQAGAVTATGAQAPQANEIYTPIANLQAQRAKQELAAAPVGSAKSAAFSGLMTPGAEAKDQLSALQSNQMLGEISQFNPQQVRALYDLPSKQFAALAEQAQQSKLKVALAQEEPSIREAAMKGDIYQGVLNRLPNDPRFAGLAQMAATGTLGAYIAQLEASSRMQIARKELDMGKIKMIGEVSQEANAEYNKAVDEYRKGLEKNRKDFAGIQGISMTPEQRRVSNNKADEDYIQRTPLPNFQQILNNKITGHGSTPDAYQQGFRDILNVGGKAGAAAQSDMSGNFNQLLQYQGSSTPYTDEEIDAAVKKGLLNERQAKIAKAANKSARSGAKAPIP